MHILAFAKRTWGLPMKSSALTNFSPQNNVPSLKHMLQTLNMRRFLHSHPIPPQMNHELFCSANSYRTFQVQTIATFLRSMVVSFSQSRVQGGYWYVQFKTSYPLEATDLFTRGRMKTRILWQTQTCWSGGGNITQTNTASKLVIYLGVQEHPQTDLPLQSELISATVQSLDPTNVFSLAFLEGAKGKPHCTTI